MTAGRSCPLSYRYSPRVFRSLASLATDTLYVVGGLYGNEPALEKVLDIYGTERGPRHLIFNGDFNWFNVSAASFKRLNEKILQFDAIRGNVETELARLDQFSSDAGCGCSYPDWVDDEVVGRSNQIMQLLGLTATGFPDIQQRLGKLPRYKRFTVGGMSVGVVHGDAQSVAGWGFAAEHLADAAHLHEVRQWFGDAGVHIFASTHTCAPIFKELEGADGAPCLVANNGAAGMPNFSGDSIGLMTRIATTPYAGNDSVYSHRIGPVFVDAVAISYDAQEWQQQFLEQWPPGTPAHLSYWQRIQSGPAYSKSQAFALAIPGL